MVMLIAASIDEILQHLGVHPRYPRYNPASEWKRMSVDKINILVVMN